MFEEEEKRGPNLLEIAAAAGIGYLGFRNRNKIFSGISKLKTKASVTLAKGAGNQTFRGVISDARNLNRAMDDLIEYSPAGILRSMKRPGLTEEIMERTAKYNVNRDLMKGRFPLDEVVNKSAKLNRNHAYQAGRDTRLEMARDLLSPDSRVGKAFGNDREAALDIYRYNVDKISELTQASKRSGKFSHEWTELIQKHEFDPKQNIKLSFDDVDKRTDFVKKLMETANEIENNLKRESAEYATSQLRKMPTPEGNRYGRYMELYDMSSYQALRKASIPTPNKAMENVMHQVSMDEARKLKVVQRNGRLYGVDADLLGDSAQDHLSVQNAFNISGRQQHPNTNLVSSKVETNFADQYIEKGKSFGLDTKALGQDIFASNLYINEATGELLNLDAPKDLYNDFLKFADNYQVPLIGISPSRFMPGRSRVPDGDDFYHIFQGAKDVQPLVEGLRQLDNAAELRNAGARSNPLAQSYLFMNSKIVDTEIAKSISGSSQAERFKSFTEQLSEYSLKGDFLLTDARVGLGANLAEVHSGRTNREDLDGRNVLQRLFGLGGQERDSNFTTAKNALSKFKDPLYGGNAVDTLTAIDPRDIGAFKEGVSRMQDNITGQTRNFDVRTQNTLYDTFNQLFENDTFSGGRQFDFNQLTNEEELLDFVEAISLRKTGPGGRNASSLKQGVVQNLEEKASYLYHRAKNNPDFLTRKRLLDDKRIFQSQMSFMFEDYADEAMTGADDLRRFVEQYAVATADHRGVDILSPIRREAGINHRKIENHIANYRSLNELSYFDSMARSVDEREGLTAISAFQNHYVKGSTQRNSLEAVLKETDPWYGTGSHVRQEKILGQTRYVAIQQGTSPLEAINERLVQAASNTQSGSVGLREQAEAVTQGIYDWSKETFAGKADNVSTNSLMPWFFANRLDTTLQQWGLGLPNEMKTSAIATVANQWARRIVLPYVAFKQLQYFDGLTGDVVSDTAADTYVNAHIGIAGMKEMTGINHVGREMERMFPWLNQIEENPFVKGFNFATMGAFSEFRSPEELEEYYVSGEDAVRKGRYWGIGSSSPYIGGRIEYFQPNWYRRAKSDYMFSENVYGSEREYWANSAIPTLTNPLAPVKHFITDPYHYEEKHADSRPYVLTGGFSELESIPLIGPVVNRLAQTVLKPEKMNPRFKSAHQDYLTQQNEQLIAAYAGMNAGGHAMISPTSFKMQSTKYDVNLTDDESGLLSEEKLVLGSEDFNQTSSRYLASVLENMPVAHLEGTSTGGTLAPVSVNDILGGETAQITSGNYSQMDLAAINQNLIDGRSVNRNDNVKQAGTLLSPNIIRDKGDWANANALFSTQGVFRDVRYNFSEMAGMYGFLTNTATGFDERARIPVLESSERFSSYADAFWDKNLGGLGGDASEIFRRYVPREKSTHYNPIRNDQPGWMPGMNYFIDFQHGDPYSKIANAEMRLPGEAYDKLYNTRKDQYGNYSALDRYRILADVAPYSDEFRLARKEVALLNQNGILSESQQAEYRQIREQVSAKMQKKQFYEKRFENADTERRQVTVDRVIDVNTFLTKEFPNNPFKFAGITIKADDEQNKELVSSMIKAGQRLTVELDKNPQTRIRGDMMDTMRAVVYAPENEAGSLFGFQGLSKGQNMNLFLSKQEGVSVKDDGSATATKALFDTTQQRVGGIVDNIVHDVLPTIPVVNLFADKFLKVQTPLEAYEDEIYSKSWRPWENPITGWVKPMFDRTAARNPIASSLHGFGIGALSWRNNRWKAGAIGALVFGGISGVRSLLDVGSSVFGEDYDVWKPRRREKEFEINEYFDRLTYVKYKGLYNRAAELAKKHEGFDLDEMYRMQEENDTAGLEAYLQNQKKWLTINKKASGRNPDFYDEQLENVKFQMNQLDDQGTEIQVGTYTALAMRYRDAYESTLYAAGSGETYDYNKIYQALPSKDKPYFTAFQKAGVKDRQRILELVPDNQRPIYQRFFGEKIQRPESNEDYFDDYNLPGNNWDGWRPDVSLDNVKLKVMQQEGIELTEANFWPDDAATADAVGARPIEMGNSFFSRNLNQGELIKILQGAGLKDVKIGITSSKSDTPMLTSELNITQHRNLEIEAGMRDFLAYG